MRPAMALVGRRDLPLSPILECFDVAHVQLSFDWRSRLQDDFPDATVPICRRTRRPAIVGCGPIVPAFFDVHRPLAVMSGGAPALNQSSCRPVSGSKRRLRASISHAH